MQEFKAWLAETILTGRTLARLWWYDDLPPQARVFKHGTHGTLKMDKTVYLDLIRCVPTPLRQTVVLNMHMMHMQNGLIMPNAVALIREGVKDEVWRGEPRFLTKPKEKVVHLFFYIEGDYDD